MNVVAHFFTGSNKCYLTYLLKVFIKLLHDYSARNSS